MAELIDGAYALRSVNHLHRRLTAQGVPDEDLERLRDIREWIRGMLALERLTDDLPLRGDRQQT